MERVEEIEPCVFGLEDRSSTIELHPQVPGIYRPGSVLRCGKVGLQHLGAAQSPMRARRRQCAGLHSFRIEGVASLPL